MNKEQLAAKLGMSPQHLSNVFAGRVRVSAKRAEELQQKTGIGCLVWLYASINELKNAIEDWAGEITDGRGVNATGRPLRMCWGVGCPIRIDCKRFIVEDDVMGPDVMAGADGEDNCVNFVAKSGADLE
jgi:transcriptional regulator with XRE-family HTH domain